MGKSSHHRGGSSKNRRCSRSAMDEQEVAPPAPVKAPLKQVMSMNQTAMSALQSGDMEGSHTILTEALEIVQQGLAEASVALRFCEEPEQMEEEEARKEAWLLALSVTVSNLGCQLRKANKSEEALTFLYKAKEAETILYGKPSSSTMLNISAILLGRGDLKEALEIARDCVSASVDGDKVLHITALHNLAMALAQQPEASEREEALNTMQRALAEAEKHVGISHPTTSLIRDRCLRPETWIADDMYVQRVLEARQRGALTGVPPKLPPPPTTQEERVALPPSAREEAPPTAIESEAAPKSGKRVSMAASASEKTTKDNSSSGKRRRKSSSDDRKKERESSSEKKSKKNPSSILKDSPRTGSSKGRKASPPKKKKSSKGQKAEAPPEPKLLSAELQLRAKKALESLELAPTPYPPDKRVPRTVPNRNLPAIRHPVQGPSAKDTNPIPALPPISSSSTGALAHDGTTSNKDEKAASAGSPISSNNIPDSKVATGLGHYSERSPLSHQLASPASGPERASTAQPLPTKSAYRIPPQGGASSSSIPSLYVDHENSLSIDQIQSSRNTTLDTEAGMAQEKEESASSLLIGSDKMEAQTSVPVTARSGKSKVRQAYPQYAQEKGSFLRFAAVEDTADSEPFTAVTYKQLREKIRRDAALEGRAHPPRRGSPHHSSRKSPSPADADAVEEEILTNQDLSAFKKTNIKEKREQLRIQQLKEEEQYRLQRIKEREEEEKEKKFRAGLALIEARTENRAASRIQEIWRRWWRNIGKPRREAQRLRDAERQKRVHNRLINETVRRTAEMKGDWTIAGLPPPIVVVNCKNKWLKKTMCLRYLARRLIYHNSRREAEIYRFIVAAQARIRGVLARANYKRIQTIRQKLLQETAPMEAREYAALVIQKLFRCHRAREVLKEKHRQHYEPPAMIIQEWFRSVLFDQRARGADSRTVERRLSAAILIQKTWRGYLGRVKYYMALLRRDMTECRVSEQRGARLLQRVCRGFIQRRYLGNFAIDCCVAHKARELYEAAATRRRQEEEEREAKRVHTPVVPRTEYEKQCLERANDVYREQQRDREEYYVPLYLEPEAERQRQAWKQAIRTNPLDVRRRRAAEDLHCELEVNTSRRHRAAVKIQREFRAWLHLRNSKDRDKDYLTICKGVYHQREYERIIQEKNYLRHLERGINKFGDVAAPQRQCVEEVKQELKAEIEASPVSLPASQIRTREERLAAEVALQRDEEAIARTYNKDMKRLRENPVDVKNRTGAMYENPSLRGLPTESYTKICDID